MKKMPPFQRADGTATISTDPKRLIWYGPCGHWTDDWRAVDARTSPDSIALTGPGGKKITASGPPICPKCKCPGFQCQFGPWWESAKKYEINGHPGYTKKLLGMKLVAAKEVRDGNQKRN